MAEPPPFPAQVTMTKRIRFALRPLAVIYQTPRLLPVVLAEFLMVWGRMWRVTLISGPLLAFAAWWLIHRHAPDFATTGMAIKLMVAALCVPLMFSVYALFLWHPRWGREIAPRWQIMPGVLQFAERDFVRWSDIRSLEIDIPADEFAETELILHLDCTVANRSKRVSLRCLRAEIDPNMLASIRNAIAAGAWCT